MKRGQEEIIGFVMIVVVVTIVLVIFLGLSIRDEPVNKDSREIYQFLESSMEYTTDCAVSFVPDYSTLGELFGDCLAGSKCLNGKDSCDVLEETVPLLIESSWQVGSDRPIKAYEFKSVHSTNSSNSQDTKIIELNSGNCTGSVIGSEYLAPAFPGNIITSLRLCF